MQIGFLGHGVFGSAIGSLVEANGHTPEYIDLGDWFTFPPEVLFLCVPVQFMREALETHKDKLGNVSLVINCSKGIEKGTGFLPHQIVAEVLGERSYVAVAGPSFASEIQAKVPTTVSIAGTDAEAVGVATTLLGQSYFVLEELGTILELELAAAMKNIYAVASGYVSGSGGGKNTHAHVQVIALREYTKLIHALAGNTDVVRPGVVGDLILTCGSAESRNFQYGKALAERGTNENMTAEGVATAESIQIVAKECGAVLPLALATLALIHQEPNAKSALYEAIGFDNLEI